MSDVLHQAYPVLQNSLVTPSSPTAEPSVQNDVLHKAYSTQQNNKGPLQVTGKANYADLSAAAYHRGVVPKGWIIDESLSSPDRMVYVDPVTKKAVVAYRGTQIGDLEHNRTGWRDLGADAATFLGLQSLNNRFTNAQKVAEAAIAKYGKDNVSLTGHSLGGSQAQYVSRKLGIPADVYNPFGGPGELLNNNYKNVDAHITHGDPLNWFPMMFNQYKSKEINFDPEIRYVEQHWPQFAQGAVLAAGENYGGAIRSIIPRNPIQLIKDVHGIQQWTDNRKPMFSARLGRGVVFT